MSGNFLLLCQDNKLLWFLLIVASNTNESSKVNGNLYLNWNKKQRGQDKGMSGG